MFKAKQNVYCTLFEFEMYVFELENENIVKVFSYALFSYTAIHLRQINWSV